MTTHRIAPAPNNPLREVETLHSAGIWAVHADLGQVLCGVYYAVTHTPSGCRVPWSPSTKAEAVALADALHAAHPTWGVDAPWGKVPTMTPEVKQSMDRICVMCMSPSARKAWGV